MTTTTTTLNKYFNKDNILITFLIITSGALFCAYMYFLSSSVLSVVLRSEIEYSIGQSGSKISQLETELMMVQHRVSSEVATLDGYTIPENKYFINREESSLVLNQENGR